MATAPSIEVAPATTFRGARSALIAALPGLGIVVGVAAAMRVVFSPWYGNYDVRYALLWARDLWQGHAPDYNADFAPTPHPLSIAARSISPSSCARSSL